uniref:Uncharacterized protein n=1 Tax=Trypanosoma congolense (strain IL3000) TaxID=1068625 RepID=G0UUV8_TRYCI|nr:conserved hypothetical protein [Trypanosoma congolense IL3000]
MVKWSSRRLVTKRLSGMVVFASLRVGDALMAAEAMRKARSKVARERVRRACGLVDPSLREADEEAPRDPTPKEEALMGAFRQEFSTSLRIRHALLHSFSENQCDKGDDTALPPCVRLFRPRCAGMDEESGDWGSYVIDLDCVYTDDINLLSELHSRWIMLTRRLLEDTCEAPPLHPEIIVIVLCTSEVTPRVSYGSLLPSVVRIAQTSNTEELRIAQWNVRVRGFPPSLKFCIPLDVLNQLSAWNGEYKAMSALDADCDWFVSQSKACSASGKWCTVRLVTSEFLKHSLFFLEWCVPEDFSFVPRCLALREEKPTTDVLARLLLDSYVSMHLEHFSRRRKSHDRPHLTVDNVRGGTKENEGGHGKPTLSAHGDTPKRVGVVHKANSPLANIHNQSSLHNPTEKPTTGIGWVSPDGMRGRSSYGAKHGGHGETCQVQRAAGHVKMAREMCSIGLLVQRYGGVVSSLFSSSGINNKERIQQEHIAVTKSGESSSILLRQLNVFQRNYHNGCRTVEAKMEAANCILRDKVPVLETLRRQYVSAPATATSTVNGETAPAACFFPFHKRW